MLAFAFYYHSYKTVFIVSSNQFSSVYILHIYMQTIVYIFMLVVTFWFHEAIWWHFLLEDETLSDSLTLLFTLFFTFILL